MIDVYHHFKKKVGGMTISGKSKGYGIKIDSTFSRIEA